MKTITIWVLEELITKEYLAKKQQTNTELLEMFKNSVNGTQDERETAIKTLEYMISKSVYKLDQWQWIEGKNNLVYMQSKKALYDNRNPDTFTRLVRATLPEDQKFIGPNYIIQEYL
jgi:hypothetical protein